MTAPSRVEAHVFRTPIKEPVRTSFGTMTERAAVFVRSRIPTARAAGARSGATFPTPPPSTARCCSPTSWRRARSASRSTIRWRCGPRSTAPCTCCASRAAMPAPSRPPRPASTLRSTTCARASAACRCGGRWAARDDSAGAGLCLGPQSRPRRPRHRRAHPRRGPSRLQDQDRLRRGDRSRLAAAGGQGAEGRRAADGRRQPGLGPALPPARMAAEARRVRPASGSKSR